MGVLAELKLVSVADHYWVVLFLCEFKIFISVRISVADRLAPLWIQNYFCPDFCRWSPRSKLQELFCRRTSIYN